MMATSGSMSPDTGVPKAPDFKLLNFNGHEIQLSRFKSKIVVLEWIHCDCTFVKAHYNKDVHTMLDLQKKYADKKIVWISINSTSGATHKENKKWAVKNKLKYVLLDPNGAVGKLYGAQTSPHVFIVDPQMRIAYQGAIDNAPLGFLLSDQYINYVDLALTQLTTGKPVAIQASLPYGCSIKYTATAQARK